MTILPLDDAPGAPFNPHRGRDGQTRYWCWIKPADAPGWHDCLTFSTIRALIDPAGHDRRGRELARRSPPA